MMNKLRLVLLAVIFPMVTQAQLNEDKLGAWYMYFYDYTHKSGPWGVQGDLQHRNWNIAGDLEQLLIRSGVTYKPENWKVKFTLGYANITTGVYGDSKITTSESRIYQEILFPFGFIPRVAVTNRIRFEERFVENQDFRTRIRYNLFVNIPVNKPKIEQGAVYIALYNELFINGQKDIGNEVEVELFDRNRFYSGVGYSITNSLRTQLGFMSQATSNWTKNQLQVSLHHKF